MWNDRQQRAIDMRGCSVAVSAAAGSGKTSVLAERVLRLIEEGEDIERMLIVTFTNLAAGEMKERIFRRLQEAGGQRLAAQAEKCAFADISTIHSFCGRVIRDNFEQAGLSPTFAVADEAAIAAMKERAMDDAAEALAREPAFSGFIERFAPRGDLQRIKDTAFTIYDRVISQKEPQKWLDEASEHFDSAAFIETLFAQYKLAVSEATAAASLHLAERSEIWRMRGFAAEADISERQREAILRCAGSLDIHSVFIPKAEHISSKVKGAPNRESKTLTNRANKCFEELYAYEGDFYAKVAGELAAVRGDACAFIELTRDFKDRYAALKRRRNVLDHDDLIHFALKCLMVPGIAARYRERYAHVFVDEYQDINDVQCAILEKVRREANDFIVGDVKQCIYMFRESNPKLLISRCEELKGSGLVEMNVNYRSQPGVIDFINGVMACMMSAEAGGVEYAGGQALEAGLEGEGFAEIVFADSEGRESIKAEGSAVAAYIKELVAQGYRYKDIAVLRPEVSTSGRQLAKALSDFGIPVISGADGTDVKFSELGVFINLLSLIDSPGSDTALLSVMRYPHFGFTEPELASIRLADARDEDRSFYRAATAYSGGGELEKKLKGFFGEIERFRLLSQSLKLPDFLMRIKREAEFSEYALTSPGGAASDAAISSFIAAASAMKDARLCDIIAYASKIGAKQQQKPGDVDAVYLTTIHKSKGLEFPAVILSGMHKMINQRDTNGPVLVGRELGLALDIIDEKSRVRTPTLHRQATARGMRRETISETIRLLYVGMTRASARLAILGAGEMKDKWLEKKAPGWQFEASTYFDLVMPALAMMCARTGKDINGFVRTMREEPGGGEALSRGQRLDMLLDTAACACAPDVFTEYEHAADLGVPSKVSVSALKRLHEKETFKRVYFPGDDDISAAERGTLTHKALQKIGLEKRSEEEVIACLKELKAVIPEEKAEFIDARSIAAFLESDIAQRARLSPRRLVEAPFCLAMSARELGLADSDESVMVQGVIDMCFIEDGNWVVVDYKTDRVAPGQERDAAEKYRLQLNIYAKALNAITGMPVKESMIYLLSAGKSVTLC
jgi:ATP-dependent helicase/nuclease subunit A